ncbi:tyrosine-type recombinase/integrase [Aquaticitalea lipolytica]|uniref:tyrosine-type recombinase/integrase n=1 Tax=Aquaticitalea lipolytica TaxID=1247562 RepID=UPI0024B9B3FE|nr:tyrosine-type recombinase/integrase [Aquaticitalea lipolytica]
MAKLTFKLREAKNNSASIMLVFNYGKEKRLRYATGFRVQNKKNWDASKMRIKNVIEELDRVYVNNKLNDLNSAIEKEYAKRTIEEGKEVTNDYIKDVCDNVLGKRDIDNNIEKLELLPFYKWFIDNYQKNPLMTSSKPLSKGTAKTYTNAYKLLKQFNKEFTYRLSYEKIGQKFYRDYLKWLQTKHYTANYIGTQIKVLKTMLNASLELEHHNNREHLKKYFSKPTEEVNHIYLNPDELQALFKVDVSNIKPIKISKSLYLTPEQLDNARDLFLISANTGLRVSDFNRLKLKNIIETDGRKFIQIITKKTQNPVTIPVNTMVNNILKKRDGHPPKRMTDQHINYAIKEVAKLAEINSIETIERTIGGVKKSTEYKKYELISNHSARRSYSTNAFLAGVPIQDIMMSTGHKTEKIFKNYVKASDLQRAIKTSSHPFFD